MDYVFKTKPLDHQLSRFLIYRDRPFHGHFWEQGTGKSKITIDTACWLYGNGEIDTLIVIAPNGVHINWVVNEIPKHAPDHYNAKSAWYASNLSVREEALLQNVLRYNKGLRCIAINVEALSSKKGIAFYKKLVTTCNPMVVVDESSSIKNHKANRTETLLDLSIHVKYKRILTGTPVTQGPLDVFSQFHFLDKNILHTDNYYVFRSRYAELQEMRLPGRSMTFKKICGYKNLDELLAKIAPFCDRVTKEECLDLPAKIYQKRYVELSDTQKRIYREMKKELISFHNGKAMSVTMTLTKMIRLQQVIGGFFSPDVVIETEELSDDPIFIPISEPIDLPNRRVASLMELISETEGKMIIWARFRSEIKAIVDAIKEEYGAESCVGYHGGISRTSRSLAVKSFQEDDKARFFVGNVQAGGRGLTLTAAKTMVYFSNDFSLENRLQSEDRAHRIGQTNHVTYVDFIARGTIDEIVVGALRSKKDVADLITGDVPIENWL